ncbi:MAG: PulJ/GspJ family protein [Lentisphaeria bacterium]
MMNKKFTIIEVLVAMTLLIFMITALFVVSSNLNNTWAINLASSEDFNELLDIEMVFDRSMPNAVPFVWRDSDDFNKRAHTFLGEKNRITFCFLHRLNNLEDGAISFIGFQQENDLLVSYTKKRPILNLDELNDPSIIREVIAKDIQSMSFQYAVSNYDGAGNETIEWEDNWDNRSNRENEERFDIPLAFKINLSWNDGRNETFLYRTAGNGQFERLGAWDYDRINAGDTSINNSNNNNNNTPPGGPGSTPPPMP